MNGSQRSAIGDQQLAVSDQLSAVSDCACFEYVGDNPYCPVHGKAAKVSEVPNEAEVLVRKSSGGKFIAMYVPARLVEDE